MADPIDDLVQHWKQNPSAATTLALCDALRERPRGPLVQQVGEFATQRHANDAVVLVSVARMYMEASRFSDAQSVLVAAGRIAPRDGNIYRWLGEALLRRGDADRAERVLERAIQLGATDAAAKVWLERARAFRPMQATAGTRAVAGEVAHATAPAREELDSENENETTTDVTIPRPGLNARAAGPPPPLVRPPAAPRFARDTETAPVAFETPGLAISPRMPAPSSSGELISSIDLEDSVQVPLPTSPAPLKRAALPFPPKRNDPNGSTPRAGPHGLPIPYPRDVMDALAMAGVYEPDAVGGTRATVWDRPGMGPKRKGSATLIAGMVMFVAATVATFLFYRQKREKDHLQAETLLVTVEAQLYAGRPDSLSDAEHALAHAFQLESRSRRAALDWARERAMAGLVKSAADVAFEDAMARAKEVGVQEEKIAFAHVASFLFQGDTAGAAAVLPRWDGPAAGDAWYQLVAGAALERAGDVRARDRYAQAVKLEPTLVVAQVSLARATAFGDDTAEAMRLAKALRVQLPDRAEPVALVALAWGRDLRREDTPPPHEVDEVSKRGDELPSGLKFVPPAIAALRAFDRRAADDTRAEVRRGLAVAESPGAAVWLGTIALPLGDEALARKAALSALQLSAVYEPARALAARVALLGGRLDEALKATEELDPASGDVAVVHAASAYERVDADGVVRALEALSPDSRKLPFVEALGLAANALSGRVQLDAAKLLALAGDDAPWSDLVAMDIALDTGDLGPADKIADMWGKDSESHALRALRLARLARYEGRMDAADALSQTALNQGTATPRVLWERSFILVARGRAAEVGPLLARYPLVLGPVATWLSAYASASSGSVEAAKGKTASLDPPPASAPLEARVVAAAAFGAMKDNRRGWNYVKDVLATGSLDPDLVAAALQLGFRKVDRYHRRPIYE